MLERDIADAAHDLLSVRAHHLLEVGEECLVYGEELVDVAKESVGVPLR